MVKVGESLEVTRKGIGKVLEAKSKRVKIRGKTFEKTQYLVELEKTGEKIEVSKLKEM